MEAPDPVFDAVCFHAQQCVEKYLKALLQEQELPSARTHDLVALAARARPIAPELASHAADLALLTGFAIAPRYPGTEAERADAESALLAAERLRAALRAGLDL